MVRRNVNFLKCNSSAFYVSGSLAPVSLAEQREGCAEVPRCRLTPAHAAVHPQLHERSLTSSVREINLYFPVY